MGQLERQRTRQRLRQGGRKNWDSPFDFFLPSDLCPSASDEVSWTSGFDFPPISVPVLGNSHPPQEAYAQKIEVMEKEKTGIPAMSASEGASASSLELQSEEIERKARVDALWDQMSKGVSWKTLKSISKKPSSTVNKTTPKNSTSWMTYLGLAPKKAASPVQEKHPTTTPLHNGNSDEAKRLAAAALSAVKDAAASSKGKVEITEVRDFAGQDIEVKKLVDANSKEASENSKATPSAVDMVLEQIRKKQKLSVLDKTKKDWGEFKEENKGLEEELDAYKKSSNQYLEKVSFLERSDYREFEQERDVRLAAQAKRKPDMRDDP